MRRSAPDPVAALEVLSRHGVAFIVVGNVAGVLHGAPVTTFGIDIVHRRDEDNVGRLMAALTELRAGYRDLTDRHSPELLIELKEHAGRPKDLAVLPVLRSTLALLLDGDRDE